MAKIFIAHSTAEYDIRCAKRLYKGLKAHGHNPWMALEDAPNEEERSNFIKEAIQTSDFFILLISRNTSGKRGRHQMEMNLALNMLQESSSDGVFFIPARIDKDCDIDNERIEFRRWIDFCPPYEDGLNRILKIIWQRKWPEEARVKIPLSLSRFSLIIVLLSLAAGGFGMLYSYNKAKSQIASLPPLSTFATHDLPGSTKSILILVADFPNLDKKKADEYGISDNLLSDLTGSFSHIPNVTVEHLDIALTDKSGGSFEARQAGSRRGAQIVIWGWYLETKTHARVNSRFEILDTSYDTPACHLEDLPTSGNLYAEYDPTQQIKKTQPIAELNSLALQTELTQDMQYLSFATIGIHYYRLQSWKPSIENINIAMGLAVKNDPRSLLNLTALRLLRADAYYRAGNLPVSLDEFSAIASSGKSAFAYYGLGRIYSDIGKIDEALRAYSEAISLNPRLGYAYYERGLAKRSRGDQIGAAEDFSSAIKLSGDEVVSKEKDRIISSHGSNASLWCQREVERSSYDAMTLYACAEIFLNSGKKNLAIAQYNAIKARWPDAGLANYSLGIIYFTEDRQNALEDAARNFRRSINFGPFIPCNYTLLSTIYMAKNDLRDSLNVISEEIDASPRNFELYCDRSRLHNLLGEYEAALADSKQAISLAPNKPCGFESRGQAQLKRGMLAEALADFSQGVYLDPGHYASRVGRAAIYSRKLRFISAAIDYFTVIILNKNRQEGDQFGQLKVIIGEPEEARKGIKRIYSILFALSLALYPISFSAMRLWRSVLRQQLLALVVGNRLLLTSRRTPLDGKSSDPRDVFICHAREDKDSVVRPLVKLLEDDGISFWYDEAEIVWGDSLTMKVNEGLKVSRFVMVVLSQAFAGKNWPERELYASLNSEVFSSEVKVLPVLVGGEIERSEIMRRYPLMNDKLWLVWDGTGRNVLEALRLRLTRPCPETGNN